MRSIYKKDPESAEGPYFLLCYTIKGSVSNLLCQVLALARFEGTAVATQANSRGVHSPKAPRTIIVHT